MAAYSDDGKSIPDSVTTVLNGGGTQHILYNIEDSTLALPEEKPFLNLGCGKTHLPSAPPPGHETVDADVYEYPNWLNVDKVEGVGADLQFDLFKYPWPLESDSYDGALLAHLCEHIGHEITISDDGMKESSWSFESHYTDRALELLKMQDGWSAFFSELYRVLTPGAVVHIVSPYAHGDSGVVDFSHTRYLTEQSFQHSMQPEHDGATFQYNNGGVNFELVEPAQFRMMPAFGVLQKTFPYLSDEVIVHCFNNVVYDFYLKLRVVK